MSFDKQPDGNIPKWLYLLLFIPCLLVLPALNNDTYFLIKSGQYVIAHGIPTIEPFTMHVGLNFMMQQWLSGVVIGSVYTLLGQIGLYALMVFCFACIVQLTYRLCKRLSDDNVWISFMLTFAVGALLIINIVMRPLTFTLIFILIELNLLEAYIQTRNPKYLWGLPVVSILLINFQAAMWPMMFVIALPYIIDAFSFKFGKMQAQGYPKRLMFLSLSASVVAGFVNPYGLSAITYLFRSYGFSQINLLVAEMKSYDFKDALGILFFVILAIVILTYTVHKSGSTRLRYVLLAFGTTYLALSSMRNFSFFMICTIIPLAYYVKDIKISAITTHIQRPWLVKILSIVLSLLCVFTMSYNWIQADSQQNKNIPAKAVTYIQQNLNTSKIRLYTGYNEGPYCEFMGLKPFLDTRAEVFLKANNKKEDILFDWCRVITGVDYYGDFIQKYQFSHLLVTNKELLFTYLSKDNDYKIIYKDDQYTLFEVK